MSKFLRDYRGREGKVRKKEENNKIYVYYIIIFFIYEYELIYGTLAPFGRYSYIYF